MTTTKDSQFRLELLAQLALQRAKLINAMLGLDAASFEIPLWEDYSIRRLFPHIGLWEGFEAERLSLINEGRLSELTWMPVDERNAQYHSDNAETSVDVGVAILQKERNGILNVLSGVSDDVLKATVKLSDDLDLPVIGLLSGGVRHDEEHAEDIGKLREARGLNEMVVGPQSVLLAAMRASRRALKTILALVKNPDELMIEAWSTSETMAHVAVWEAAILQGLQDGRMDQFESGNHINDSMMATLRKQPIAEIWQVYADARKATIGIVEGLDSAELSAPFKTTWPEMHTIYHLIAEFVGHDIEHADEIYGAYLVNKRTKK